MKLGSSVKTTSLLWLAPQKHRDMLRSLTAGLVCMCLIDGIEDCHVACWLLAMTYGTILIK